MNPTGADLSPTEYRARLAEAEREIVRLRHRLESDKAARRKLTPSPMLADARSSDCTEADPGARTSVEQHLRRTNRALRTLVSCNHALVAAEDEQALMDGVCRAIVEDGGYRLAWIGLAEHDASKSVRPVAHAGVEEGYLDAIHVTWGEDARGQGPTGTCIRTRMPCVVQNIPSDPAFAPWRAEATRRAYASSIALPLVWEERTLGALCIYAPDPEAFDDAEVSLLGQLAGGLSFGIVAQRARAAHHKMQDALLGSEERLLRIFETVPSGLALTDESGHVVMLNSAAESLLGSPRGEIIGRRYDDPAWHPAGPDGVEPPEEHWILNTVLRGGIQVFGMERSIQAPGRERIAISVNAAPFRDANGSIIGMVISFTDITERKRVQDETIRRNRQLAAMNAVSAAVGRSIEIDERLAALRPVLARTLGFPAGILVCTPGNRERRTPPLSWGLPSALARRLRSLAAPEPAAECPAEGVLARVSCGTALPAVAEGLRALGYADALHLRLGASGHLCLLGAAPPAFSDDQVAFYTALGELTGAALANALLYDEVRAGRERLQFLSQRLLAVQEEERGHIARELHDEIGQALTGIKLTIELARRMPAGAPSDRLEQAHLLVGELIGQVREISLRLRPSILDDLGLLPALLWHFDRYTARTGVRVAFTHSGIDTRLAGEIETAAYRIVQEALTNAARHAGVEEVVVAVRAGASAMLVTVEDQGRGFDPVAAMAHQAGSGLGGLRERAALLGGVLTIDSAPSAGTRLTARIPLSGER